MIPNVIGLKSILLSTNNFPHMHHSHRSMKLATHNSPLLNFAKKWNCSKCLSLPLWTYLNIERSNLIMDILEHTQRLWTQNQCPPQIDWLKLPLELDHPGWAWLWKLCDQFWRLKRLPQKKNIFWKRNKTYLDLECFSCIVKLIFNIEIISKRSSILLYLCKCNLHDVYAIQVNKETCFYMSLNFSQKDLKEQSCHTLNECKD